MAIGMGTALLGSAVIGGVGSAIAGSKNNKAINRSTQASTQAHRESIALQNKVHDRNEGYLSPYVHRGNAAGNTMNALLGLGGSPAQPAQQAQTLPTQQPQQAAPANALAAYGWKTREMDEAVPRGGDFLSRFNLPLPGRQQPQAQQQQQQQPQQPGQSPQEAANSAFDIFRNSTGYQFRLGEGMNALNSGYAGAGVLQSGDAMRAATEYGQNFASNEFGNYMGYLGNQQGVGLSGASALAGVGQGYANNITNLNNQNAQNITNAAVAKANNTNAMIGGIGNAFTNVLGGLAYGGGGGGGAAGFGMPLGGLSL